ncbi:hypothetical protein [Psychrobacter sp. JCM 18900]|uniref:hypothetical protein n=1 Tax=Psychrobacter sp. JCM 18900 TaxID=1298608 RepID=UPI0004335AFB|nr:hypothetical protein [Psychrobacter sp. JCM 18900]GAF53991.1 hypothetical protein JCM18900_12606 [Psychrobacter sp. JCM 18900]
MTIDNQLDQASEIESEVVANTDGLMMQLDYAAPSQISQVNESSDSLLEAQTTEHTQHVALFAQLNRSEVNFHGKVKSPLVFRDSLLALFDVVSSDYRYVPKDRSAYTVFMQMRRASSNKNLFTAQRDYFTWLFDNDPLAFCILDPIIQVHEQGVSFEVFSRDEGCYAQLTLTNALFEQSAEATLGTTSIDYSTALFDGIQQIRDHQQTVLDIGHEAVGLQLLETMPEADNDEANSTGTDSAFTAPTVKKQIIEKRINVPKSWIRALLQVQSAHQLPQDTIHLDPIALYNVLFELRMHADIKGKRRGLLIELRPQQLPIIVLEPFDITVTSQVSQQQTPYQGQQAKLIRLWGRRRLSLLKRLLPHADSVSVSLLGQGMPSYWTVTGKGFHFTFAMTGFSQANWSQSLNFDLLLPKRPLHNTLAASEGLSGSGKATLNARNDDNSDDNNGLSVLMTTLANTPSNLEDLVKLLSADTSLDPASVSNQQVQQWLLSGTQQGLIRYDVATQLYHYRPLTQAPLEMAQFAYHNEAEKQAFDLLSRADGVQNFSVETVAVKGITIRADIHVEEDRRTYHSQLQLGDEGLVTKAECSCPQYLQHRLTHGVCAHLIALRLRYNQYDPNNASNDSWHDTRVLSKRVNKTMSNQESVPTKAANNSLKALPSEMTLDLTALTQPVTHSHETANNKPQTLAAQETSIAYVYITIAHKKITIEQTTGNEDTRQQLVFNQPAQAKAAYLQHIARFEAKGFIENQGM